ncbi:uncharacterized protein FOMMEDRAFT_102559 [Fomitiporia mediterranea MF3/22]|uniref:uncharacterized protein n=1 Tax=Fomitiporia mediterranea (strain MF3/22) TaxID=694068 RepID=UPI0004408A30|nr:uncharacterized protein FOMMEDRAFT_102559 [Fomitiporia mediterranea MF3/22]EJD06692.1 hypothetical protein FOMMEDRAFT_102559 [Fomitiporia mediterranea MF3/22]
MGRTRVKNKKATSTVSSSGKEDPSIESLFSKAQSLLTQCDYDLSQKFALRILQRAPHNADAKELLGVTQLEKGELEEAMQTFQSLLPPAPGAPNPPPPSAHLYLAQLSEEDPHLALKHYEAAVGILHGQLKGKERATQDNGGENESDIRKNIVRVLVAMVEIWMAPTYDLCFDPRAEETCESLLKTAFETDPDNVEALICLSSFRLSQQRPEEAKDAAMKAWLSFKDVEEDDSKLPPIPTRIELSKRFIESSEYSPALSVLQTVMASDDQEVEAWYLEGWCFFLMAEQAKETETKIEDLSWEELAKDSRDCLESCRTLHTNLQHSDDELLKHTSELINQLDALGIKPTPAEEGDDGGEEEQWEDVDGSDEDVEMS